ncbi:MAG TPA: branched-chain amino acid ABC transporter substrate-binding protein [Longimicrobium sp.]|nr:branched-chain amino acid ABC transporter substrate-binding protein [Longimicrobium sp.]
MKIRNAFLPLLLCAAPLLAGCRGGSGDTLVIGVAGPLEKANGRSMKLAAQMAIDEINRAGGIAGRQVRVEWGDDDADPAKAIEVARRLRANAEVLAVVGHVNSAASLRAATIYNAATSDSVSGGPVVEISPASSSPQLTAAGDWTFRICPTDLEFSPALARTAAQLGRRKAAVIYADDDYGQGVAATFRDAFSRAGGAVVTNDPYLPVVYTEASTLDPYLQRAFQRGADALVIGGQATEGIKIIAAARRLGFTGPILGSDGLTGVKDFGAVAEGVYVSSAFLPDRRSDKAQQFVARYRERFKETPDHRGAMTYDVIYMLKDAIEHGGAGRRQIRDYVAQIGRDKPAFEGVSGTIRFDRNGDAVGKEVTVGRVQNGQLVTVR